MTEKVGDFLAGGSGRRELKGDAGEAERGGGDGE